ncbi:MAG: SAM-dependent methyltransferase [Clostridia bacterium]|nr:SAM-dependent methyltransferase [Clostridia bacterium]
MTKDTLDGRLLSCAGFVRAGGVLADVGTDHAYLPIFLLKSGKIKRAVLSDVNEGPLSTARENAEAAGVLDLCDIVLTDGAAELSDLGITDYAVCGMGGELIARIVSEAPDMKREGVHLILQPMSRQAHLRRTLYNEGYSILDERYSAEGGKYYVTLLAEYTGEASAPCEEVLELGADIPHPCDEKEYVGYLITRRRALISVKKGKSLAKENTEREESLIRAIDKRLREYEK